MCCKTLTQTVTDRLEDPNATPHPISTPFATQLSVPRTKQGKFMSPVLESELAWRLAPANGSSGVPAPHEATPGLPSRTSAVTKDHTQTRSLVDRPGGAAQSPPVIPAEATLPPSATGQPQLLACKLMSQRNASCLRSLIFGAMCYAGLFCQ